MIVDRFRLVGSPAIWIARNPGWLRIGDRPRLAFGKVRLYYPITNGPWFGGTVETLRFNQAPVVSIPFRMTRNFKLKK